jgi:hypothetical protein
VSNGEALACVEQAYTNIGLIYAPKFEDGVLLTINDSIEILIKLALQHLQPNLAWCNISA